MATSQMSEVIQHLRRTVLLPDGAGMTDGQLNKHTMTVKVEEAGKEAKEATFKLDPAAKPKSMDVMLDGETMLGIYSLDGDMLKLCGANTNSGKDRPTEFATKEGSGHILLILKRKGASGREKSGDKDQPQVRGDSPKVSALKQQIKALELEVDALKAHRSPEGIAGVLVNVDVGKSTVNITLKGTKLTLEAIPLATYVKFSINGKEAAIDDLKMGMPVLLQLETDDQKSVVTVLSAQKKEPK